MTPTVQLPVRLDREIYEELQRRAQVEGKSMNQIIRETLKSHFHAKPIPKARLRDAIWRLVRDDAEILDHLIRR
jgi:hypothetical protein